MAHGKLKHFKMGAGVDKAGLGRWTWARFRGSNNIVLRTVSIYLPNQTEQWEGSVWNQQKTALNNNNDGRDPKEAFMQDLAAEMREWIAEGDQLIVGGDVNEHIFHPSIVNLFGEFNMRNLIFSMHNPELARKTYSGSPNGRVLDGMWCTPGIQAVQCGYIEPKTFYGDHSMIWADITYTSSLGHNPPLPMYPDARKLRTRDRKTMKRYLKLYKKKVKQWNLVQRQLLLEQSTTPGTPLTPAQQQEADAIDHLRTKAMLWAESRCRKLRMGNVDFSDATDGPIKRIQFWELAIKRNKHGKVSPRLHERRKKAAKVQGPVGQLSHQGMLAQLRMAQRDYREAKKKHREHR